MSYSAPALTEYHATIDIESEQRWRAHVITSERDEDSCADSLCRDYADLGEHVASAADSLHLTYRVGHWWWFLVGFIVPPPARADVALEEREGLHLARPFEADPFTVISLGFHN